jgi:hypothetical protein
MIILGDERTVEQDPAFAIRIIVDIADKALSPAINDPTTAVQALNHLSDVLRRIGMTDFSRSRWRADDARHAGVVIPARSWQEYLTLGLTEVREYGVFELDGVRYSACLRCVTGLGTARRRHGVGMADGSRPGGYVMVRVGAPDMRARARRS